MLYHLCKYMRICLFYWSKVRRAYIFYNQIDWSSDPGSATCHVNLVRLFNLSDPQIFYNNIYLAAHDETSMRQCVIAPTSVPSMQFVFSKHWFLTACTSKGSSSLRTGDLGFHPLLTLPTECPGMLRHPPQKVAFKTLQAITPGLMTFSISEYAYFLINFLLSAFTFIPSKCDFLLQENVCSLLAFISQPLLLTVTETKN